VNIFQTVFAIVKALIHFTFAHYE